MKTFPAILAAFALSSSPATSGEPVPTQDPGSRKEGELICPQTGGLKIGQARSEAFKMMARTEVSRDVTLLHAPANRPYKVDVTFASASETAEVVKLHYVFNPPAGLLEGILDRYGKPTATGEHATGFWEIAPCGVTLRYRMVEAADHRPLQEEMTVEPLGARPSPGTQTEKKASEKRK